MASALQRVRGWCALLGVLSASGCASYVAPIARDLRRGQVELVARSALGDRNAAYLLVDVTAVPPGTRLLGASLTAAQPRWVTREERGFPCEGWWEQARAFGREPARPAGEPLRAGERLSLRFPGGSRELVRESPRLSLWLESASGAQRCVELPLTDPGERLPVDVREHFTLDVGVRLEPLTDRLGPITGLITFPLALGVWLDRVHVEVGAAIGVTMCPREDCPFDHDEDDPEKQPDSNLATTWFAGGDLPLHESGDLGVGIGVRYRLDRLTVQQLADHEDSFWAHGPVLTPYIAAVRTAVRTGYLGGAREAMLGFELPIGYMLAGEHGQSLLVGLNLRVRFLVF